MTRWRMIKGVWGSLGEWRHCCEQAKRDGWTLQQVERMMWFHPLYTVIMGPPLLAIIVVLAVRAITANL